MKSRPFAEVALIVDLECAWEDKHKTSPIYKNTKAYYLVYTPIHYTNNSDLEYMEVIHRWHQLLRAVV